MRYFIIFALFMSLGLVGCGGDAPVAPVQTTQEAPPTETTEYFVRDIIDNKRVVALRASTDTGIKWHDFTGQDGHPLGHFKDNTFHSFVGNGDFAPKPIFSAWKGNNDDLHIGYHDHVLWVMRAQGADRYRLTVTNKVGQETLRADVVLRPIE